MSRPRRRKRNGKGYRRRQHPKHSPATEPIDDTSQRGSGEMASLPLPAGDETFSTSFGDHDESTVTLHDQRLADLAELWEIRERKFVTRTVALTFSATVFYLLALMTSVAAYANDANSASNIVSCLLIKSAEFVAVVFGGAMLTRIVRRGP